MKIKEHPILFSTEMIKAILDGKKTQTRRVIKPSPVWIAEFNIPFKTHDADPHGIINCPYGKSGDLLYVRETFCILPEERPRIWFKAGDENLFNLTKSNSKKPHLYTWEPAIHMPKKYARIWLKVKDIRIEHLNTITRKDIIKEGVCDESEKNFMDLWISLWDSIKKKSGYGWDTNPYVWVVEFERIER